MNCPKCGQPASGRSGKNNALPVILIAAVIAVIVMVNVIMALMPSGEKSWEEQYELGVRYLSESDYEQAIVAFTAAIEIDAKEVQPYLGRAEAYVGMYGVTNEEEYLPLAISDCETALSLDETLEEVYVQEAEIYILLEDYESAADILDRGLSVNSDSAVIEEKRIEVTEKIQEQSQSSEADSDTGGSEGSTQASNDVEEETDADENADDDAGEADAAADGPYMEVLTNLMAAVSEDITNIGVEDWYTDEFEEFIAGLDDVFTVEIEDGWYLSIDPRLMEDYTWFYYGQLNENGSRDGIGYLICAPGYQQDELEEGSIRYYVNWIYYGEFADGSPNGHGQYCLTMGTSDGAAIYNIYEMDFLNGYFEGDGTFTYISDTISGSCAVQASNGHFASIYSKDGSAGDDYIIVIGNNHASDKHSFFGVYPWSNAYPIIWG